MCFPLAKRQPDLYVTFGGDIDENKNPANTRTTFEV